MAERYPIVQWIMDKLAVPFKKNGGKVGEYWQVIEIIEHIPRGSTRLDAMVYYVIKFHKLSGREVVVTKYHLLSVLSTYAKEEDFEKICHPHGVPLRTFNLYHYPDDQQREFWGYQAGRKIDHKAFRKRAIRKEWEEIEEDERIERESGQKKRAREEDIMREMIVISDDE